jgi:hypothetical protein
MFQKRVHPIPVMYDIHMFMQRLFQLLLHMHKNKQVGVTLPPHPHRSSSAGHGLPGGKGIAPDVENIGEAGLK